MGRQTFEAVEEKRAQSRGIRNIHSLPPYLFAYPLSISISISLSLFNFQEIKISFWVFLYLFNFKLGFLLNFPKSFTMGLDSISCAPAPALPKDLVKKKRVISNVFQSLSVRLVFLNFCLIAEKKMRVIRRNLKWEDITKG